MARSIRTLTFRVSNAYLVETDAGFILIDTGFRFDRRRLDRALVGSGCRPGDLKLIVITHGDPDYSASAANLREAICGDSGYASEFTRKHVVTGKEP